MVGSPRVISQGSSGTMRRPRGIQGTLEAIPVSKVVDMALRGYPNRRERKVRTPRNTHVSIGSD